MPALPLAYFHGMPGGPGEWAVNAPPVLAGAAWLIDRNDPAVSFDGLAAELTARFPDGLSLIGFSAGAFAALQVALRMGARVRRLNLISPAAPLQLGNFLPDMAGGPIFRMAADHPRLFAALAGAERLLARHAPGFLLDRLFATAQGGDAELALDPVFRGGMARVLREGLGRNAQGFAREVLAYVADWRSDLARITAPVTIWQGEADNWTPPAMGQALHGALPGSALHMLPGCSHYSALRTALERI